MEETEDGFDAGEVEEVSLEELFSESGFKERHPFLWFIDYRLMENVKMFHYAPHVIFSSPWDIISEIGYNIKWAWQRVFRGWDDRIVWDIDYYLSEMLPVWVYRLKDEKNGVPVSLFNEDDYHPDTYEEKDGAYERVQIEYDEILSLIAEGFLANKKIRDESLYEKDENYQELKDAFDKGFELFKEYFGTLWD